MQRATWHEVWKLATKHLPPKSLDLHNKPWEVARFNELWAKEVALGFVWMPAERVLRAGF